MTYLIPQQPSSGGVTLQSSWRFSTTTAAADPGTRTMRYDNATPANVLNLYINDTNNEGFDASTILGLLSQGNRIYVQQQDDAANATLFELTGPAVDNTGWWTVPVSVVTTLALPVNNKACAVIMNLGAGPDSPVIAGHIRAGNTQLVDGEGASATLSINANVTEATWESVGPTGSGADNIWTIMDAMPDNATILIVDLFVSLSTDSANTAQMAVYVTHGDDAVPAISANNNRVSFKNLDNDVAITGNTGNLTRIMIPLGATNQDFQIYWDGVNNDSALVSLYYRGFIAD